MRKYGGFIPGIRPGRRTSDFVNEVLTRITLVGALYLVVISLIPQMLISGIHLNDLFTVFLNGSGGIESVVNGTGAAVSPSNGGPSDVVSAS